MIRLNSETLSTSSQKFLKDRQSDIDGQKDFEGQAKRADQLWGNKGSKAAKRAFSEIKEKLIGMCVGTELCNYCENNEAADIEHIYPKKIFPEKAFQWENYLLACKKCNTTHKQEKFFVFDPAGSATVQDVKPPRGQYLAPPNDDAAFIDPRIDDPMEYLWLDLTPGAPTFFFREKGKEGSRTFLKAQKTLEILQLNERNALPEQRKSAAIYYLSLLRKYIEVKEAADFGELKKALDDFREVDETNSLQSEKEQIQQSIQQEILQHAHPTVWYELIRQRENLPHTQQLFQQAPEALAW
jgi:uncharacterized protein (TIGR02646 family)